jgi:hypothetical protein
MDFSSLSKYPTPQRPVAAAGVRKGDPAFPQRVTRILVGLVFVAAVAGMLYELRRMADAFEHPPSVAPPPPLDFKLVQARYSEIRLQSSRRAEVERLLGQPTQRSVWGPEFTEREEILENQGKNRVPPMRRWDKWSDPTDEGRWVAVFYADYGAADTVYWTFKKGF